VDNPAPTSQRHEQTIDIGGVKKTFSGSDELDVTRQVNAYMREQFSQPAATPARDAATGRFTSAADQAQLDEAELLRQGDLKLRIMRGETSVDDAVGEYLTARGIDPEALRRVSEQASISKWETAVTQFQQRHPDYVGGTDNLAEFQRTIQALNLFDSPSVESIEAAFADMQKRNAYYQNRELTAQQEQTDRIKNATSAEEVRSALGARDSSFWSR
jgi:hypothetical protein